MGCLCLAVWGLVCGVRFKGVVKVHCLIVNLEVCLRVLCFVIGDIGWCC